MRVMLLLGVVVFAKVRSRRVRQAVLLAGSYALYVTWGVSFASVLLTSTVMNFLLGRWLRQKPSSVVLWIGISQPGAAGQLQVPVGNCCRHALLLAGEVRPPCLPLGISFWTFQAMSYLLDLYRGEELDPSFVEFALVHGVLSGGHLRADLPHARDATAVSLRGPDYDGATSDVDSAASPRAC